MVYADMWLFWNLIERTEERKKSHTSKKGVEKKIEISFAWKKHYTNKNCVPTEKGKEKVSWGRNI